MISHILFYYSYASFTNAQLPLLKVAALWFDKLIILDTVSTSWDTIGANHAAHAAIWQFKDANILEIVTSASVMARNTKPIAEAIRRDIADREFLDLCGTHSQARDKQRWTPSLAKVPQGVCADQAMCHLMSIFARKVSRAMTPTLSTVTPTYRWRWAKRS